MTLSRWPWIERKFRLDFPPTKLPDLLERVRGTPLRVEAMVWDLSESQLSRNDGRGWSIKQNIGHLIDLGFLPLKRIEQILAGERDLIAADMSNRKTNEASHDETPIEELLAEFKKERAELVERFESIPEKDWGKSALHPRLKQPMRIVDIAYFDSEHDDYHLARIRDLIQFTR